MRYLTLPTLIYAALSLGVFTGATAADATMAGPLTAAARTAAPSLIEQLQAAHGQPAPFALALDAIHPGVAGTRVARLHHTYRGVRIWQSESVVTLADDGAVVDETLTDRRAGLAVAAEEGADALPERPPLSEQDAINLVLSGIERGARPLEETTAELVVYPLMARTRTRSGEGKPLAQLNALDVDDVVTDYRLAYVVSTRMLIRDELQFWDHIISAEDGHLIDRHYARNDVAGTGHSQYNGTVALNTTLAGGKYLMKDASRGANGKFGALAVTNADNIYIDTGALYSDADNQWGDGLQYVSGASTTGANGQTAAVNAMFGLTSTYDTMKNVMNWYSLDGNNTATHATVHYGAGHGNAGYVHACRCIQIGDAGNGGYKNLGAVDVLGHEMGHGVTAHTSKLPMYGEAGALNESGADINGEMAEAYARNGAGGKQVPAGNDWLLGREIMPQGQTLRYLQKPSKDGKSRDAWSFDIGKLDPHYSSGANNRMFYFLSQGSDAKVGADGHSAYLKRTPKAMTGIGNDKAYRIWFTANTTKFAAATNYATARNRMLDVARQLYGDNSAEAIAVQRAYAAINVGDDIDELGYKSPVALLTQPASTGVTLGRPANFTAYAEAGTAPYFYAWYKNGARVRNVTGPGYSFIATAADAGAKITVRVTDSANLPTTAASQTAVLTINPPGTLYERIANGGFEDGELDWAGHLNNIGGWSQYPAHAGKKMAWFGSYESSAGTALYQALTIPANTATAKLSFALRVGTTGNAATARDHFRVELRGLFNQPLALVKAFSNLDAAPGFVTHSFDLSAFRGQTVRLRFASSSDGNQSSWFMLDDVSLKTE
jgi:Zn-dependent metalloprotease